MNAKQKNAGAWLTVFLAVLGLMLWSGSPCRADEAGLIPEGITGYSAVGPRIVFSISPNRIVLSGAPAKTIIDLTNKKVVVKDKDLNPSSLASIGAGSRIKVFQKKDKVYIQLYAPVDQSKKDY